MFVCKKLIIFILLSLILNSSLLAQEKNETQIDEYLDKVFENPQLLKKSIGQLFLVSVYADHNNYYTHKETKNFLDNLAPSGIILRNQNFYNLDIDNIKRASSFISFLHEKIYKSSNLPPFIAVDFEGENYNSLKNTGLITPPSSLTMGTIMDPNMVRKLGQLIGYQLKSFGVNMLLGPVVDVDKSDHATGDASSRYFNSRYFGSRSEFVASVAINYIWGLKEGGLNTIIIKHFPGLDPYVGNVHKNKITPISLKKENSKPFKSLIEFVSGVMTSHVTYDDQLFTISSNLIDKPIRSKNNEDNNITNDIPIEFLNSKDSIVMTDDLSDMESIRYYKDHHNIGWKELAFRAFDAGHDILLFSNINTKINITPNYDDILDARNYIFEQVESTKGTALKVKLRSSLKRILISKLNYWKQYGITSDEFFKGFEPPKSTFINEKSNLINASYTDGTVIKLDDQFLLDLHKEAFLELNTVTQIRPNRTLRYAIFTPEKWQNKYESISKDSSSELFTLKNKYDNNDPDWEIEKRQFVSYIKNNVRFDYVVLIPDRTEHFQILDYARLKARNTDLKKIIVLIHGNPKNISNLIHRRINIFGSFSENNASFIADVEFLNGNLTPKSNNRFPLDFAGIVEGVEKAAFSIPNEYESIFDKSTYQIKDYEIVIKDLNEIIEEKKIEIRNLKKELDDEITRRINDSQIKDLSKNRNYQLIVKKNNELKFNMFIVFVFVFIITLIAFYSFIRLNKQIPDGGQRGFWHFTSNLFNSIPISIQETITVIYLGLICICIILLKLDWIIVLTCISLIILPVIVSYFKSLSGDAEPSILSFIVFVFKSNNLILLYFLIATALIYLASKNQFIKEKIISFF